MPLDPFFRADPTEQMVPKLSLREWTWQCCFWKGPEREEP